MALAAPVGKPMPPMLGDLLAEVARMPRLMAELDGKPIDEAFFAAMRAAGIDVPEATVQQWYHRAAWVREDCGDGHRWSAILLQCARCGERWQG